MIPTAVSVLTDGTKFRWTYGVVVTTDVAVKPGDSFTIYDFAGLNPGTIVAPTDWSFTVANSGPARSGTNPTDDASIPNINFTYNGSADLPGQAGLGNFWALSDFDQSGTGYFTSSTHRQVDGRLENNITTTDVPVTEIISETPEPATLLLLAAGIPALGLVRRFRRK